MADPLEDEVQALISVLMQSDARDSQCTQRLADKAPETAFDSHSGELCPDGTSQGQYVQKMRSRISDYKEQLDRKEREAAQVRSALSRAQIEIDRLSEIASQYAALQEAYKRQESELVVLREERDSLAQQTRALTKKAEEVTVTISSLRQKYEERLRELQEKARAEIKSAHEKWAASEKVRREQWMSAMEKQLQRAAEARAQPQVAAINAAHAAELDSQKAEHERVMRERISEAERVVEERLRAEIRERQREWAEQMTAQSAQHRRELSQIRDAAARELQAQRQSTDAALAAARTAADGRIATARADVQAAVAENSRLLQERYEREIGELKQQLITARQESAACVETQSAALQSKFRDLLTEKVRQATAVVMGERDEMVRRGVEAVELQLRGDMELAQQKADMLQRQLNDQIAATKQLEQQLRDERASRRSTADEHQSDLDKLHTQLCEARQRLRDTVVQEESAQAEVRRLNSLLEEQKVGITSLEERASQLARDNSSLRKQLTVQRDSQEEVKNKAAEEISRLQRLVSSKLRQKDEQLDHLTAENISLREALEQLHKELS